MKKIYLILSVLGAVIPYAFFSAHIAANGLNLILFVKDLFVNGASAGFSADLFFTSFVFWLYIYKEKKVSSIWPVVLLNLTIGLSCAFPYYLYQLEKKKP